MELACDKEDLEIIKKVYGSRAQTIIDGLLAWDAFISWYYPYAESIPFRAPREQRLDRAFDNMCRAIDMHECYERISINNHKSFCPHIAIFKVCTLPPRQGIGLEGSALCDGCGLGPMVGPDT